ncbi:ABC transporter ATP-binding protein [Anaerosoma tenue]|uniref:ABC transporter ATP-binding protein n=1 Tax=Anaerosoma tenue TaxID=2933588 RepID=UPI002260BF00|nr:ABC transporter ATP-binding protein [Anaerosoma tenue]MCK8113929.1 ABC transporter ATP-binding protein [Anaerosoma tenue]
MALLEVTNLKTHFTTRDGVVRAVDGVTFEVKEGHTLAIVGESGSGKSVTALSLMRLIPDPPGKIVEGQIMLRGESVLGMNESAVRSMRGDRIAMIFQDPMTSLNPVFRVGYQIGEALRIHKGMTRKQADARAVEMLDLVGIPNPAQRARDYPHQFSGGMRQRAMIAMALACDPDILIADEPTTALDVTIQAQILELMIELQQRQGTAIIMITHDLGVVADMANDVMVMYAGKQVEYGKADEVFYRPLHPYTWGLLASLPRHDVDEKGTLLPIEGQPPSLIDVPPGCAFHPRCPYAQERCKREIPELREVAPAHLAACHFAGQVGFGQGAAGNGEGVA